MSYKDVLAPVIALDEDEAALVAAGEIAQRFEAKATALVVAVRVGSEFSAKAQPLSALLHDISLGPRDEAGRERARIVAWLERAPYPFDMRDLTVEGAVLEDRVVAHARASDLVVMAQAPAHRRARRALTDDILFKSGRPLLLVPAASRPRRWETIVIGWNARLEAVRAVSGALPLVQRAERVVVVTVDAEPSASGHSKTPGHEIAVNLARHGARVEVQNVDGMGRTDAQSLLDAAMAVDADALVLGAYGHWRAQQLVFGGVTRELLHRAPLPLLLAR